MAARVPAPPPVASALFGDRLPLAIRFAEWLAGAGVERGLVGPRETARIWERHLLNCAAIGALVAPGASVVDIGSGAGLPGLPLAIARPDLSIMLVESMLRRTAFLCEVVADLELSAVSVRRSRAEELARESRESKESKGPGFADVVTARAVAPIDKLARWALPLAKKHGVVLALKGAGAVEELASAWPSLRALGVADARVIVLEAATEAAREAESPIAAAIRAFEVARWPEPAPVEARPSADQIAVVTALSRFPQALSRSASIGLG